MNESKYNLKSIIVGLVIMIIGIILIPIDLFWTKTNQNLWISVGCSLIASGIVILMTALLVEKKEEDHLAEWGLDKIYKVRSDKNKDSDPKLKYVENHLDAIAFGLKSFRNNHGDEVEALLRKGVNVRILTMNPSKDNCFLKQREIEEETPGQIRNTIEQLVSWADKLNSKKYKGHITVKGYKCMTLDFYWRMDNEIYIGPYWYHYGSQQTITYKFIHGKMGFDIYSTYFEKLWSDKDNTIVLTKEINNG